MSKKGKAPKEHNTLKTVKFMLKIAWQKRPSLFLIYGLQMFFNLVRVFQSIILTKLIIDQLMLIINGGDISEHLTTAVIYVLLTIVLELIGSVSLKGLGHLKDVTGEWFTEYFEEEIGKLAMNMDFEHTENPDTLDQLNKATTGMSWYSGGIAGILDPLTSIIENIITLAGVITIIIIYCPLLLIVQIIALVLITILTGKNNKIEIENYKKLAGINRIFGYVLYQLADFNLGKDIRLYDSAELMGEKADYYRNKITDVFKNRSYKQLPNTLLMDLINGLRDGISYLYIGWLAISKVITVGDFSMCVSSSSTLYWSMRNCMQSIQTIIKNSNYSYEYIKFLNYPSTMPKGTKKTSGNSHVIEFRHVGFKYPRSEKNVLRDINITIKQGEHLSVVGLNGAGKTTFIKLLCRLYDVTEGEILLDGINIKEYSDEEYRKIFAVVFQDFNLFAFSLRDNIALGKECTDDEIDNALKLSGFYDDSQKLEYGLDTHLFKIYDDNGTELSGGQQQKTAISRALYRNAPIVILDEPTAALDPVAEYDIYRHFDKLVGGRTAIYISHRLSSCKFCDKIAVFSQDTIKEYGTHDELVSIENGIYAEMFEAQAQYYVSNAS